MVPNAYISIVSPGGTFFVEDYDKRDIRGMTKENFVHPISQHSAKSAVAALLLAPTAASMSRTILAILPLTDFSSR